MKKSHFLKTLYLQKPLLLIVLIATLSTLPWIGLGDFYTKGEPREAALAISMIEKGEWIIPSSYADEFAYKPPLSHWLIAGFSLVLTDGEVTPFTSRLPSTLAFIGLIGVCFMFFARRRPVLEAFVACLILITCFEIHRSAMTTRVDMVLTFFLVAGLIQMYLWNEKRKISQLLSVWFLLSMATLSKGPVGILLPCLIFGVFLLLQKENFFRAALRCVIIGLPALIIPFIWYYAAYEIKGDAFFDRVFYENVGRFIHMDSADIDAGYELGHENPFWIYVIYLASGLLPSTLLLLLSLFFIKYSKPSIPLKLLLANAFNKLMSIDKVLLFSLSVFVISLVFYSIPISKRSVYIMLVYPFIAIFIARFLLYLTDEKPKSVRIFTSILVGIGVLALLVLILSYLGIIDENTIQLSKRERTLRDVKIFFEMFRSPGWAGGLTVVIVAVAIVNSVYLLRRNMNVKVLMAGFGLMLAINIYLDGYLLAGFKAAYSSRPFAELLSKNYNDLEDKCYVTNNLKKYGNLYGLNFYLHNRFKNIEIERPQSGYLVTLSRDIDKIKEEYSEYEYTLLESSDKSNEHKEEMLFFRINRKK